MCHLTCFILELFPMKRGCRQGYPISPYIYFAMSGNNGNHDYRNNTLIKGIVVNNNEFKLLQYADDTVLTLDSTQHSLKSSL